MNFDLQKSTIFLTLVGSRAYGFHNQDSDYDYRGICIPPLDTYIGVNSRFEQEVDKKTKHVWKYYPNIVQPESDMQIMELTKFCRLAADCNPSIIEILFSDESSVILKNPIMSKLLDSRDMFLSRRAKARFCGYALSQLNRIKRHKRWLDNPPQKEPTRSEFGLPEKVGVISADQIGSAEAIIRHEIDQFIVDQTDLPEYTKIELGLSLDKMMRAVWCSLHTEPYPIGENQRFESMDATLSEAAMRQNGFSQNFMEVLKKEKQYRAARQEWDSYQTWLMERNPARAELERKFGYDCYLDDTEFLTEKGWKRYDEISDELSLATLHKESGCIEFQRPVERVKKEYNGPIVFLETQDTACAVTPNHRMWVSEIRGGSNNKLGTAYTDSSANWHILKAQDLLNGKRFSFHARTATEGSPKSSTFNDFSLIVVGAYVSEGCVGKRLKNGKPSVLRFSQKENGRLEKYLEQIKSEEPKLVKKYSVKRNEKNRKIPIIENVYILSDKDYAQKVVLECGEGSKDKHLPNWIINFSKERARFLLDILVAGDGTERKYSKVYYTSSKRLADDIQILAIIAGYTAKIWGPYENAENNPMYQVYIGQDCFTRIITKGKQSHFKTENVFDRKIVCFTVPNEILITRRNGKVAVQGNTKHACHLVRLIRMCREILETGQVLVKRPDAEELRAIRCGDWSYEGICTFAENEDRELNEVAKKSKLKSHPDMNKIQELVFSMILDFNGVKF